MEEGFRAGVHIGLSMVSIGISLGAVVAGGVVIGGIGYGIWKGKQWVETRIAEEISKTNEVNQSNVGEIADIKKSVKDLGDQLDHDVQEVYDYVRGDGVIEARQRDQIRSLQESAVAHEKDIESLKATALHTRTMDNIRVGEHEEALKVTEKHTEALQVIGKIINKLIESVNELGLAEEKVVELSEILDKLIGIIG